MTNCASTQNVFKEAGMDKIQTCVHCGLCLDVCPTYRELGSEQDSPRGRLYLMRGLWEGELSATKSTTAPLSRCLDCRACESACPSGVPYGELLEKTRGILKDQQQAGPVENFLRWFFFAQLFPHSDRLTLFSILMKAYIKLGIPKLITGTFLSGILPKRMVENQKMIPDFAGESFKLKHQGVHTALGSSQGKALKVGLFTGCVMDVAEHEVHESCVQLLRRCGHEVVVLKEQSCCGALHVHNGERDLAKSLAKNNLEVFKREKLDAIIVNAAGCGAQLKEYQHLFEDEPNLAREFENEFSPRVIDVMEFLSAYQDQVQELDWKEENVATFYDAPCHLIHAQGVDAKPRDLMNATPGIKLLPIPEAEWCCGSAGIYNLLQPELSASILDRKIQVIRDMHQKHPEVKYLVTGNPGCLFQLQYGIRESGIPIEVLHPSVLLKRHLKSTA